MTLTIRPSTDADLPAVAAIYAWNVAPGTGTFKYIRGLPAGGRRIQRPDASD